MGKQTVVFDQEAFVRTAALFESKRMGFSAHAIETLAGDIVHHLAKTQNGQPRFEVHDIRDESVDLFCDALVQPDPNAAFEFIENRRA